MKDWKKISTKARKRADDDCAGVCQTLLPKVEYFFVQLNWHESHCCAQYVTKITLTSGGALHYNPDFFCYGKYKNDNIIMVILLRIVDNSATCWARIENISRTTKLFDNKCRRVQQKMLANVSDAQAFCFPTTCGGIRLFVYFTSYCVDVFLM